MLLSLRHASKYFLEDIFLLKENYLWFHEGGIQGGSNVFLSCVFDIDNYLISKISSYYRAVNSERFNCGTQLSKYFGLVH